jgi:hypothetical protein
VVADHQKLIFDDRFVWLSLIRNGDDVFLPLGLFFTLPLASNGCSAFFGSWQRLQGFSFLTGMAHVID